jgi:hypothetical protein
MSNAAQNRQQATEEPDSRSSLVVHRQHPYRLALPSARYEHDDELTIMVLEVAGDLKKEGKADQKAGEVKEFLEGVKDKAEDLVDTVKDKITKH